MSGTPGLDSFGEIYPGFGRHRRLLKAWLKHTADEVWRESFEDISQRRAFFRMSNAVIARATMHALIALIPPDPPGARKR